MSHDLQDLNDLHDLDKNPLDNPLLRDNTNSPTANTNTKIATNNPTYPNQGTSIPIATNKRGSQQGMSRDSNKPPVKLPKRWPPIPDIIIDDVTQERHRRRSNGQLMSDQRGPNRKRSVTPISNYNAKEERIMWL